MSECATARYRGSEVFLVGRVLEWDLEVFCIRVEWYLLLQTFGHSRLSVSRIGFKDLLARSQKLELASLAGFPCRHIFEQHQLTAIL